MHYKLCQIKNNSLKTNESFKNETDVRDRPGKNEGDDADDGDVEDDDDDVDFDFDNDEDEEQNSFD